MQVKRFVNNPFQEISYLLFDDSKEAVIIDCGCVDEKEQKRITEFIERKELTLKYLLNTHLHLDHIAGNSFVKNTYGLSPMGHKEDLPIYLQASQQATMFGFPLKEDPPEITRFLNEGDTILFGQQKLEILHVPGHSPGSICFLNREEGVLISGDVIFERSIGRTDLYGGDLDTLVSGIKEKILSLDAEVVIGPGHGNLTSVGDERQNNPFLQ